MKPVRKIEALLFWLGLLHAVGATALSSDPEQPMNIEADQAMVDEERGITEYKGSVVVTQGSLRITADTVSIFEGNGGFDKAILEGAPARFRQRPDGSQEYVRASAKRIEYMVPKSLLILVDDAVVNQGTDTFSGNRISYDTKKNQVKARKSESGGDRVKITIGPRGKPSGSGDQ